jgi:hypothetical protein
VECQCVDLVALWKSTPRGRIPGGMHSKCATPVTSPNHPHWPQSVNAAGTIEVGLFECPVNSLADESPPWFEAQ